MNYLIKKIKITARVLFFIYMILLLKLILFKGSYSFLIYHFTHKYSWQLIEKKIFSINIIPFTTIYYYLSGQDTTGTIPNLAGNILLFVPFGFLLPLINEKFKLIRYVIIIAFLTSLLFEILQLLIAYGTSDIDDCILNTSGAIIGFLIFKFWRSIFLLNNSKKL